MNRKKMQWIAIAENYKIERERLSFPYLLVDPMVKELTEGEKYEAILDFGAGIGTISKLLYEESERIYAYEPMDPMRKILKDIKVKNRLNKLNVLRKISQVEELTNLDLIVCINVFDHILDIPSTLNLFSKILNPAGRLILSIPHPIKNLGCWIKEQYNEGWHYLYYRLDDYLREGEVKRNREDVNGNLVIEDVISQHRTVSTYYNWIIDSGFQVMRMYEPVPKESNKIDFPILYTQSSRIPYFWILDCFKKSFDND